MNASALKRKNAALGIMATDTIGYLRLAQICNTASEVQRRHYFAVGIRYFRRYLKRSFNLLRCRLRIAESKQVPVEFTAQIDLIAGQESALTQSSSKCVNLPCTDEVTVTFLQTPCDPQKFSLRLARF